MLSGLPSALKKRLLFTGRSKISPLSFRKHIFYEKDDLMKIRDLLALAALIFVLSWLIGGRNTLFLAIFVFLILNPAVYYLKGGSSSGEEE
jgi:hypothetical protein